MKFNEKKLYNSTLQKTTTHRDLIISVYQKIYKINYFGSQSVKHDCKHKRLGMDIHSVKASSLGSKISYSVHNYYPI